MKPLLGKQRQLKEQEGERGKVKRSEEERWTGITKKVGITRKREKKEEEEKEVKD